MRLNDAGEVVDPAETAEILGTDLPEETAAEEE